MIHHQLTAFSEMEQNDEKETEEEKDKERKEKKTKKKVKESEDPQKTNKTAKQERKSNINVQITLTHQYSLQNILCRLCVWRKKSIFTLSFNVNTTVVYIHFSL